MKKLFLMLSIFMAQALNAAELAIALAPASPTCNGGSDGSIIARVTGGAEPYSIVVIPTIGTITEVDGVFTISDLPAGSYSVTATDANNDTAIASTIVEEPQTELSLNPATVMDVLCNGASTGSITLNITNLNDIEISSYSVTPAGGTTITLTPPAPPVFTDLPAASYTTTVDAANGDCAVRMEIITQPDPIVITPTTEAEDEVNQTLGTAIITVIGGTPPYDVLLNPGNETAPPGIGPFTFTDLTAGNYTITVTDVNGCTATLEVTVPCVRGVSANALTNFFTTKYCKGGCVFPPAASAA